MHLFPISNVNDFNVNDKRNCDELIQKAHTVFSEFDIIEVGTVGNPLVLTLRLTDRLI